MKKFGICTLMLLTLYVGIATAEKPIITYSPADKMEAVTKEAALDKATLEKPFNQDFFPVKLYCDDILLGLGVLTKVDGKERIITCANLFPKEAAASEYSFRKFFGDTSRQSITSIEPLKPSMADSPQLAVLKAGPTNKIIGFWETEDGKVSGPPPTAVGENWKIRSLYSGKEYRIYSNLIRHDEPGIVFEFEPTIKKGEGGAGFVDTDGNLIILEAIVDFPPEVKMSADMPPNKKLAFGRVINPLVIR